MTIKKYLTTPEEILALRDTDTKIYHTDKTDCYFKFVQGVLCYFCYDGSITVNAEMSLGSTYTKKYIIVEEPVKEEDRGMLCKFIRKGEERISILTCFTNNKKPVAAGGDIFDKCYRLTPAEVAEITGYKVEE